MRVRVNVVLGVFLLLAMAFGFTSAVSAQDETGTCQYSVGGNGTPQLSGSGISQEDCRALLEEEFGAPLGTAPGTACQITILEGEIQTVQGDCAPGAAPAPTATTAPAPTATTAPGAAPTATTAPAPETPDEPDAPEAPVEELPETGSGAPSSSVDSGMLLLGTVATVLAGAAIALRRRAI